MLSRNRMGATWPNITYDYLYVYIYQSGLDSWKHPLVITRSYGDIRGKVIEALNMDLLVFSIGLLFMRATRVTELRESPNVSKATRYDQNQCRNDRGIDLEISWYIEDVDCETTLVLGQCKLVYARVIDESIMNSRPMRAPLGRTTGIPITWFFVSGH